MKIINNTNRLICIQTKEGRVDVLPGVVTDNKSLGKLKGKNKIFDHYLETGDFKEVKGSKKSADKTPDEDTEKKQTEEPKKKGFFGN